MWPAGHTPGPPPCSQNSGLCRASRSSARTRGFLPFPWTRTVGRTSSGLEFTCPLQHHEGQRGEVQADEEGLILGAGSSRRRRQEHRAALPSRWLRGIPEPRSLSIKPFNSKQMLGALPFRSGTGVTLRCLFFFMITAFPSDHNTRNASRNFHGGIPGHGIIQPWAEWGPTADSVPLNYWLHVSPARI